MKLENKLYSLSELSILLKATSKKFEGQREYKEWNLESQVKYIESIYMDYPIPSFFIGKILNGSTYLIDGQHRHETYLFAVEKLISDIDSFKEGLLGIYLERVEKDAYSFLSKNKEEVVNKLMKYIVNVNFILWKNEKEVIEEGPDVFNYLNSTRNEIPDGVIIKNKLLTNGVLKEKIKVISDIPSKNIKYTKAKLSSQMPLLDIVRSLYFSTMSWTTPKGVNNYGIPAKVNSELNSQDKVFLKKTIKMMEKDSFISGFYSNIKKQKIGLNNKNNASNSVQSTYLYPVLAVSFKNEKANLITSKIYTKYMTILDELLTKESFQKYKSYVHGSVRRTASSILIIEGILDDTIKTTQDFIDKFFTED